VIEEAKSLSQKTLQPHSNLPELLHCYPLTQQYIHIEERFNSEK